MSRPNLILLTTLAHRWHAADTLSRMPNVGALRRHGTTFSQAICTVPLALPSRASLLSGLLPSAHGVRSTATGLPSNAATLPRTTHAAGYLTGAFGRIQLESDPVNYGLDRYREIQADDAAAIADTGDHAVRFVQSARPPFLLWANFPGTLVPDDQLHDERLAAIDSQIGRILATVLGRGHSNNVIVYASEHGWSLPGDADPASEGWLRVPLIVSGAGDERRGESDDAPAQLTDVLPTLLDSAGIPLPKGLHGVSLLPRLQLADVPVRAAAYAELPGGIRVVRTARYKLVGANDDSRHAFFDLQDDAVGQENIYGRTSTILHQVEMTKVLRRFAHA